MHHLSETCVYSLLFRILQRLYFILKYICDISSTQQIILNINYFCQEIYLISTIIKCNKSQNIYGHLNDLKKGGDDGYTMHAGYLRCINLSNDWSVLSFLLNQWTKRMLIYKITNQIFQFDLQTTHKPIKIG